MHVNVDPENKSCVAKDELTMFQLKKTKQLENSEQQFLQKCHG